MTSEQPTGPDERPSVEQAHVEDHDVPPGARDEGVPGPGVEVPAAGADPDHAGGDEIELLDSIEEELDEVERRLARMDDEAG